MAPTAEFPENTGVCREHLRLTGEYTKALRQHLTALEALEAARPTVNQADYTRMRNYVEQSWEDCEHARLALAGHLQKHGCMKDSTQT
jgi:hypothetical protein